MNVANFKRKNQKEYYGSGEGGGIRKIYVLWDEPTHTYTHTHTHTQTSEVITYSEEIYLTPRSFT